MKNKILLMSVLGAVAVFASALPVDWQKDRKKVVAFGWEWQDIPPASMLEHAPEIAACGIDGISLYLKATLPDGRRTVSSRVVDGYEWTDAMLEGQVDVFSRMTRCKGLRECFIRTLGAPRKRVDWKSDEHWAKVAESMRVMAKFAKRTGIRGFIIDPEDYHKQNQFEARANDEPYDLLASLARKRGREIFTKVFSEYPEIVILGYWLFSWHPHHVNSENPMGSARASGDLWPAFLNGMLDVMPPQAKLVDGNEWAYESESSRNEFMISAVSQRNAVMGLVAPENRTKYRAQAHVGFGLYMDSYVNAKTNSKGKANHYYFGPVNGSRRGHFERNLSEALDCAGEYVWLWCEKKTWVKWPENLKMSWGVQRETWESCLPGLYRTIRACSDPDEFLAKDYPELLAAGKIVNLATDDYVKASRQALHGKHDKKDESSKGPGYFHVTDPAAKPGEHYVVDVSGTGEGLSAVVFWQQRANGGWWRWRMPGHGLALVKDAEGRSHAKALVRVPEGVDCLAIQFRLRPPKGKECEFDSVFVGKVTY